MTCIVAIRGDKGVLMGADSCAAVGNFAGIVATPKVAKVGSYLIGYTSSFRMGQLLHFALSTNKPHPDQDLFWHLVNDFIPSFRRVMRDGGAITTKDGADIGGQFLLAHGTRLFGVNADFSVLEYREDFWAVGCGTGWAMGAMFAMKDSKKPTARERAEVALKAAATYSGWVKPPYHFVQNY